MEKTYQLSSPHSLVTGLSWNEVAAETEQKIRIRIQTQKEEMKLAIK